MTRIFDDEQTASLVRAMANPESNVRKMVEQNQEIGVPLDITRDILNKYATYGANTGIGNVAGNALVEALNEEYRKRVDAPLQEQEVTMASVGTATAGIPTIDIASLPNIEELIAESTQNLAGVDDLAQTVEDLTQGAAEEALNSPVRISTEEVVDDIKARGAPELQEPEPGRLERFQKYLEDNPMVAQSLKELGPLVGKIIGTALADKDEGPRRGAVAPRPRFQPGRVNAPLIGMSDGGKPSEGSVLGRKLFLEGGEVDGPGGPKEDLVPIWASDKEYVLSHDAVKRMGGGDFDKGIATLDKINFGK
jgi:hypothetical protein